MSDLHLVLLSFVAGLVVGVTSIGGAALITPFLILLLGIRPVLAVGTDLVYAAVIKIAGTCVHWKQGTIDARLALSLACGSIPGGALGVLALSHVHPEQADAYVRSAVGVTAILVAVLLLAGTLRPDFVLRRPVPSLQRHRLAAAIAWGAVVGFTVGLTSIGSGSLMVPFLLMLFPDVPARVVGTNLFHAVLLVTVTALLHARVGHVDWRLLPLLLAGSLPGVLLGSYLAPRIPARGLRLGLGVVLLATGVRLM